MRAPGGGNLKVHGSELVYSSTDGIVEEVRLVFVVSPAAYEAIAEAELFHLAREMRGPGADRFEPDGDVQIEARLEPALLPGMLALGADAMRAGPALISLAQAGTAAEILETESWYALNVTIEVLRDAEGGVLREGYSTLHAAVLSDEDDVPYLTLPMLAIASAGFEEREMEWQETTDDEVIRAEVSAENGTWTVFAVGRESERRCTIYSQAPWNTPEEVRDLMAETITRINFGLPLGNFEMDYADGEVRFKTSIDVTGDRLSTELFDGILEPNLATMDSYLPALEAVRDGRMTPEAAVEMVEG